MLEWSKKKKKKKQASKWSDRESMKQFKGLHKWRETILMPPEWNLEASSSFFSEVDTYINLKNIKLIPKISDHCCVLLDLCYIL